MSLKLRVKYKYRSATGFLRNLFFSFALPEWLLGTRARAVLLFLILGVGVAFVLETSALGTSGYQVHALEQQVAALTSDIQKVSSSVAEAQSITSIQNRLKDSGMVVATGIQYAKAGGETVVAKR